MIVLVVCFDETVEKLLHHSDIGVNCIDNTGEYLLHKATRRISLCIVRKSFNHPFIFLVNQKNRDK